MLSRSFILAILFGFLGFGAGFAAGCAPATEEPADADSAADDAAPDDDDDSADDAAGDDDASGDDDDAAADDDDDDDDAADDDAADDDVEEDGNSSCNCDCYYSTCGANLSGDCEGHSMCDDCDAYCEHWGPALGCGSLLYSSGYCS